jgi:hypothetical protein
VIIPNPANALREIVIARSSFTRPCAGTGRDDCRFPLGVAPGMDSRLFRGAPIAPPSAGVGIRLRRAAASGNVLSVTNAGRDGRFSTAGMDTRTGTGAEVRIGDGVANGAAFISTAVIFGTATGGGVTLSAASAANSGPGVIPGAIIGDAAIGGTTIGDAAIRDATIGDAVTLSAATIGFGVDPSPAAAIGFGVPPATATAIGFGVTSITTIGVGVPPVAATNIGVAPATAIGFGVVVATAIDFGVTFSAVATGGGVVRSASAISFSVSLFSIFVGAGAGTFAGCMLKELRPK